jgi:tetratricopeptide (TPR) repeat protein
MRGGHAEAIAHYCAALDLVRLLPEGVERMQQELACLLPLALSLAATLGYAADEVKDVLTRAREICGLMGDAAPLFPVLHGLSKFWTVHGDQALAEDYIRTCLKIAEQTGNPLYIVESAATLVHVLSITGQWDGEIASLIELGPRVYDENETVCRENWSEANAKTSALSVAPHALYQMGRRADSERAYREALTWARSLGRPFDLAHTLCFTSIYNLARDEHQLALIEAEEAASICESHGYGVWLRCARAFQAIAMANLGDWAAAKALLVATIADWKKLGCGTFLGFFATHLAQIEAELGRFDEALALAREGIALAQRHHDFAHLPDAHQTLARILLRQPRPDVDGAEAALREGLRIARSQGARMLEAEIAAALEALAGNREAITG